MCGMKVNMIDIFKSKLLKTISRTWSKLVHIAISPHVISAPNRLQTRLNGRIPTVVRGAK
jgi:hypothetical protein